MKMDIIGGPSFYPWIPLRKCRDCGLEAKTIDDLESFVKSKGSRHGRMNLCKECSVKPIQEWREEHAGDARFHLSSRLSKIKQRCYNPTDPSYKYYGGRGIIVCQEWLDDPDSFVEWGVANGFQRELTIDRIDNDGSYSPDNCRWATMKEQSENKRTSAQVILSG